MTPKKEFEPILPHENDILDKLDKDGYFKAIHKARLSKKKFLETLMHIQEEERKKLGHELHDNVNSSLAIAKFYLSLLPAATKDEKHAKEQLAGIISSTVENIRSISCNLVMFQEVEAGLIYLVDSLLNRIRGLKLFNISFGYNKKKQLETLPDCQKIILYRIIQEQLNNIIKYSRAHEVSVNITVTNKEVALLISDNGVGFDLGTKASGIGLSNISNRVKQFNGLTSIKSGPGKGCVLKVQMPILE